MANRLCKETFLINIFILDLNWFLFNESMVLKQIKRNTVFGVFSFEYANIVNSQEIKKQ